MKSTITFTATVALPAGGTIAVQADDVPIAGADLFDLVGMMFEQVPPGILAATGMLAEPSASTARTLRAEPAPTPTVAQVQKVHQPPKAIEAPCWGVYPGGRLPDPDAVAPSLKGVLDGLVDAGVVPDDTGEWVKAITYLPAVKEKGVDAALHVLIEDVG